MVDGILDQGLPFVASYLEKIISRPIIITDDAGKIHYPAVEYPARIEALFMQLPPHICEGHYYHKEASDYLYYHIGCNGTSAYIIVKNIAQEAVPKTLSILAEAKLAIKCYFYNFNNTTKNKGKGQKEQAEYLFFHNEPHIREIIKIIAQNLDSNKLYFAEIMEVDGFAEHIDWQAVYLYSRDYLKKAKLEVIPLAWSKRLLLIVSICFNNNTLELNPDWPKFINKFKEAIETRFKIIVSKGIGRVYPLADLDKSYNEACLALKLSRLMEKSNFSQKFSDLGVFSLLFSQETEAIKNYCLKSLGQILEYDEKNNSALLPTLRILLDTSVNWKQTADTLFIHVNTLYYRVEKIEKLLNVDLSKMETRTNLFIAIKVWDTLKSLSLLDD